MQVSTITGRFVKFPDKDVTMSVNRKGTMIPKAHVVLVSVKGFSRRREQHCPRRVTTAPQKHSRSSSLVEAIPVGVDRGGGGGRSSTMAVGCVALPRSASW